MQWSGQMESLGPDETELSLLIIEVWFMIKTSNWERKHMGRRGDQILFYCSNIRNGQLKNGVTQNERHLIFLERMRESKWVEWRASPPDDKIKELFILSKSAHFSGWSFLLLSSTACMHQRSRLTKSSTRTLWSSGVTCSPSWGRDHLLFTMRCLWYMRNITQD